MAGMPDRNPVATKGHFESSMCPENMKQQADGRILRRVLMICLIVYLFSAKGYLEVSDTGFSLETAQAIVNRGALDIPYIKGYTLAASDGRSYSKYGIGLALYYIPLVAISNLLSRFAHMSATELAGALISFANIPFAMLALVMFARLLRLFGVTGVYAWLFPLALGLGTLTWRYAGSDMSEEMQMGFLIVAVYGVVSRTFKGLIIGAAGFAAVFLVKLIYAAFFPLFLLYLATRPGELRQRIRAVVIFSLPFVLAGCFVSWLNVVRFGNPLESGYGSETGQFFPSLLWRTVPALLVSLDKGLFVFCPLLILGVFGWKEFASRYRAESALCGGLLLVNLLSAAAWHSWGGGWAWGPRLLVPTIPLWLLPAAFCFTRQYSRVWPWAFVSLMMIAIAGQIPGILVKDQEIHDIKDNMLTAREQRSAPSDYAMAWILLEHKLSIRNEVYSVSEFHIPGDERELDLTPHRTLVGLNIWTEHIARQTKRPVLRWLPALALLVAAYQAMKVRLQLINAV